MADLQELEEDLKRLLGERGERDNLSRMITTKAIEARNVTSITLMAVEEHGQPYINWTKTDICEHEQSYKNTRRKDSTDLNECIKMPDESFMAVEYHGQPYKTKVSGWHNSSIAPDLTIRSHTDMAVEHHGQPYKTKVSGWHNSSIAPDLTIRSCTDMAVEHHGQPYKTVSKWSDY